MHGEDLLVHKWHILVNDHKMKRASGLFIRVLILFTRAHSQSITTSKDLAPSIIFGNISYLSHCFDKIPR